MNSPDRIGTLGRPKHELGETHLTVTCIELSVISFTFPS